ncbi:iron chelate uptake ABC transporter family permease subunit [Prauserella sp. ASG 168]|uniref:Iron chelate uptake ABC transporter family permease subunit n=2 Tax=Prauserella cavernicola TaxID=2800127 RepID=A0A934QPY5_9PSEU|nr:iron chelate uptake ABC transporter family permease subunit [Prauserella cavernicola]MBK1784230.1 iron chelate uptake ABC transporter family permease subunit [Prauserella cavernicola]
MSVRVAGRSVSVCVGIVVVLLVVMCATLMTGEYQLSVGEVLGAVTGTGEGSADFIVNTLRMPRLLTALFVGAALAASGAILQGLTRNPLGSPDFIGFNNGAATGALLVIIVFGGGMYQIAVGALLGAIITALLIYVLAFSRGVHGFRFVLIGIGLNALALAVNSYLITRASLYDALTAQAWLVGSVNGRGWEHVAAAGLAILVLLPLALYHSRSLAMMELGDDSAKALGVGVQRSRAVLIVVSVLLAAFATAAAGPIVFVALAAPQLARRLTKSASPGLISSALMGGLLLIAGDFAIQRAFPTAQLPVGTATGCIGGLYLIWLLASEWRGKARYS